MNSTGSPGAELRKEPLQAIYAGHLNLISNPSPFLPSTLTSGTKGCRLKGGGGGLCGEEETNSFYLRIQVRALG